MHIVLRFFALYSLCVWWCPIHIVLCFVFCPRYVYGGVLCILYCVFCFVHTHNEDKTKNIIQYV
jgi:hypothetical protein